MRKVILSALVLSAITFVSCSDDDEPIVDQTVTAPATYKFERNGSTTVSYSGQTTRIKMAEELISALNIETSTLMQLKRMFAHEEGNNDFSEANLNTSSKSVRSKTAASKDFFSSNSTEANAIKIKFDGWIKEQVEEVFPKWGDAAEAGKAGKIQENGGAKNRYVNVKGLELNQAVNKALIGGLMVDQILNNYLSVNVLDEGTNVAENDAGTVATDKNYTTMEHKWDEAFGYLYGTDNAENPQLGADSFLSKYISRVEGDPDYAGIADEIYNAFKLGRAAIVAKNYKVRDEQAKILRDAISKVIAIRAIYYLQQGKDKLTTDKAAAFHDLSEGYGFIESLRFTRDTSSNVAVSHLAGTKIEEFTTTLLEGDGFWDVTEIELNDISEEIGTAYGIDVKKAASTN